MRLTRILIGGLLIVAAIWVIVGERLGGTSANAMVNARLATLRSPIAGIVTIPDMALGATVRRGDELASVADPQVDRIRLNDLVLQWQNVQSERDRLRDLMTETKQVMERLAVRAATFERGKTREVEIRLIHARSRLALLQREAPEHAAQLAAVVPQLPADPRGRDGATSDAAAVPLIPEEIPTELALAIEHAREEVGVLQTALAAARDGVHLVDGFNDAPFASQRLAELRARHDALEADHASQVRQVRALAARITEERVSVNRLAEAPLATTFDGRMWEALAHDGENLQRGDAVMRLLDCESLIVTGSVSEGVYNRLRPGDSAQFRLTGSGELIEGTVERLAGSGAASLYDTLAIAPSGEHLERYDVAVSVPGLAGLTDDHCPVGRTGRLFFEGRPLDWLRDLL
ncbi:HlyD family efflux transporter periplasmic adaptor subunit (plasmid) [Limimaricola variabilis]